MRFGPDAFYIDRNESDPWAPPNYEVDERSLDAAHLAIQK